MSIFISVFMKKAGLMRESQKKQIISTIDLLDKAHNAVKKAMETGNRDAALTLLEQCQDSAIRIGGMIEESEGEDFVTISLLENYCEQLYQIYEQISRQTAPGGKVYKNLRKDLIRIENSVKNDICVRKSVVFLPYKASMWDSLESVWRAADADPDCDAYVIPIPYFDKNPDGTLGQMHYEGDEFPKDIPVIGYEDYDFETNHPDVIFIHNPYDECNFVTSVHPFFYTKNLKKFTDKLVYIPYFILGESMYESMCVSPGTVFSDVVIVHSAQAKEDYIKHLKKLYKKNAGIQEDKAEKILREKILPLGSPKIDKVINGKREAYPLPEEWKKLLAGKKAVLYNTGVSGILHGNEQELKKIKDTIDFFAGRDDVALWWRPHPLTGGTMQSMRPALVEEYQKIVEDYKASGIGIFDDTADLHRAVLWTDMYYGDDSSLVYLYGVQGKPIVRQNINCLVQEVADDKSISYGISCSVDGSVYFSSWNYNGLYRLDVTDGKVYSIGKTPQELSLEVSLYSNIIYQDGTLWLVPSRAHALAEYHLETGQWTRYELSDRIKSSALIEDKIYMISSDYRHLWIMDLKKKKLTREEMSCQGRERLPLSDDYYNSDLYLLDHKLYFLITHSDLLAAYDLEKKQTELLHISDSRGQYQRLVYDGSCFYFLPNSEKSAVACWDGKNGKKSAENGYPEGFSGMYGFLHAVFRGKSVWLFPYKGNMVLRVIKENMEIDCVLKLEEVLDIDMPRIDSVQELSDDRVVMAVSNTGADSRIVVFDADNQILDQYPCECQEDMSISFDSMFQRLGTEKYTSANAYQTNEGIEYSLSHVCDALVNGEPVYGEEKNYFRSLYANSDGTAGAHIWEEVKA